MIILKASPKILKILKEYSIDIDALQHSLMYILQIYTNKFNTKDIEIKIVCRKNNKNYGLYEFESKKIAICTPCLNDKNTFLSALLHEFRHWIQHSVDGISPLAILSKGIKYEDNAYEQQCCRFEEVALPIILNSIDNYEKLIQYFKQ